MTFFLYKSPKNNQWYWRLTAENNLTIANGGEGYHNKADAFHAITLVQKNAATTPIFDSSLSNFIFPQ